MARLRGGRGGKGACGKKRKYDGKGPHYQSPTQAVKAKKKRGKGK